MPNTTAYGFVGLENQMAERVTTVGVQVVWDAVRNSAAEWDRVTRGMLSSFAEMVATHQERYYLPGSGTLQPLDEFGNPKPVRPSGYFDVAYPIKGAGTAWGDNRVTRALMKVEEANRFTLDAMSKDADWLRRHMLAAIFTNTTTTYDDQEFGDLTIQPLANGDAVAYELFGGSTATDTHHLAQASAIDNSNNPYTTLFDELQEHPSNRVSEANPVVCYIPSGLRTTTEALSSFYPVVADNLVKLGVNSSVAGQVDRFRGFGNRVLGVVGNQGIVVVEWSSLPANYIVAHATGAGPFLGMREYPDPSLKGVITEGFSPDGNRRETRWIRYAGFGVRNRIGAAVMRVGNGSYAIPSGYTAPLAS